MLDLDEILEKTLDIKLNGKVIHVIQPSIATIKKLDKVGTDIDKLSEVITEVINNNKDNIEITQSELEKIPAGGFVAISQFIIKSVSDLANNPN